VSHHKTVTIRGARGFFKTSGRVRMGLNRKIMPLFFIPFREEKRIFLMPEKKNPPPSNGMTEYLLGYHTAGR